MGTTSQPSVFLGSWRFAFRAGVASLPALDRNTMARTVPRPRDERRAQLQSAARDRARLRPSLQAQSWKFSGLVSVEQHCMDFCVECTARPLSARVHAVHRRFAQYCTCLIRYAGLLVSPSGEPAQSLAGAAGPLTTIRYGAHAVSFVPTQRTLQTAGKWRCLARGGLFLALCAVAAHDTCLKRVDRTHTTPLTLCRSPFCCEGGVFSPLPAPPAARGCCDSAPTRAPAAPLVPASSSSEPVGPVGALLGLPRR